MSFETNMRTVRQKLIPALRRYQKKGDNAQELKRLQSEVVAALDLGQYDPEKSWTQVYGQQYGVLRNMYNRLSRASLDVCLEFQFPGSLHAFVHRKGYFPLRQTAHSPNEWYALFFLVPQETIAKAMPEINEYVRNYINTYNMPLPTLIHAIGLSMNSRGPFYECEGDKQSFILKINIERIQALHSFFEQYTPLLQTSHRDGGLSDISPRRWLRLYIDSTKYDLEPQKYQQATRQVLDAWKNTFQEWYKANPESLIEMAKLESIMHTPHVPKNAIECVEWLYDVRISDGIKAVYSVAPELTIPLLKREIFDATAIPPTALDITNN